MYSGYGIFKYLIKKHEQETKISYALLHGTGLLYTMIRALIPIVFRIKENKNPIGDSIVESIVIFLLILNTFYMMAPTCGIFFQYYILIKFNFQRGL